MPTGKDLCTGCEDFRPLLQRYRNWKEDPETKLDVAVAAVRPLSHEDAIVMMRFIKHWPTNPHMAPGHVGCLIKSQEDIETLRGITLSLIALGVRITANYAARQEKRSLDADSLLLQTSTGGSSSTETPRSENPTPSSEPEMIFATASSPQDKSFVDLRDPNPEVIDICDSPELGPPDSDVTRETLDSSRLSEAGPSQRSSESRCSGDPVLSAWLAKEMDEFSLYFHRVFLTNYPLYVAARCFMPQNDRRNEIAHHPYLQDNFVFWISHNGLAFITDYFSKATTDNTDLSEAYMLVTMSYHVRHFVYYDLFTNSIATFRIHVINYLLSLPLEEFRKPLCRSIAEMMWTMRKDAAWPHSTFDLEGLNLAHKFFSCSSHLTLRLVGISEINNYIGIFHEMLSELEQRLAAQLGTHMARWILDRRIVEEIFGQNAHVELISRSVRIIEFLSQNQCLSLAQIDCIWNAAQMNYISRQVFEMLPSITRTLEPPLLMHLYGKLREMEAATHTEHSINVVSAATKTIWSYAINQKPPLGVQQLKRPSVSYTLQDKGLPYHSGGNARSSSEASSGTSNSGSEDDSNSEEYESDEQEGTTGVSKIPEIATFYRGGGPSQNLNPKCLQLRLAQVVADAPNGGKIIQIQTAAGETSEEGSSDSAEEGDEDEEEDDEDDIADEPLTATSGMRHPGRPSHRTPPRLDKTKRSTCPSREPATSPAGKSVSQASWPQGIRLPVPPEHTKAIMEQLLGSTASTSKGHASILNQKEGAIALSQLQQIAVLSQQCLGQSSGLPLHLTRGNSAKSTDQHDDDLMAQGSDCAEIEVNSSTSDMSEKVQDLDLDLSEAMPEEDIMDMEEDDVLDATDMARLSNFLGRTSEEALKIKNFNALSQKCRQNYNDSWKTKEIDYKMDDVTKPGMTLLWDFIQANTAATVNHMALFTAERELTNLIVTMSNPRLAMKFADACQENVKHHRAVAVSLRLLPKLIQSFHCNQNLEFVARVAGDFFTDLMTFVDAPPENEQQKSTEIRVRLTFLQLIYSNQLTEKKFRLKKEQLDIMWTCFVVKLHALDELCTWLLQQLNGVDNHALSSQVAYHLFYAHLGRLEATAMTLMAFKLYQQCLQYLISTSDSPDQPAKQPGSQTPCLKSECADRVWIYAMFGEPDVSDLAIKHLNTFYLQAVKAHKDMVVNYKEQELYKRSMEYITPAMQQLDVSLSSFTTIMRCFALMRKQIESYRQRYGFHLRLWQLAGCGVLSHNFHFGLAGNTARSFCFFHANFTIDAGQTQEVTVTLASGQFLGELKAEILFNIWKLVEKHSADPKDSLLVMADLYGFLESRGAMYINHRQVEFGPEQDEQTLQELGFRQETQIYVTFGTSLRKPSIVKPKDKSSSVMSPPPLRDSVPMLIAASPQNFEIFFELQRRLDLLGPNQCSTSEVNRMQAAEMEGELLRKQLSRHLWEFLMMLPTSESVLSQLRLQPPRDEPGVEEWKDILPGDNPHRLLYALQALDNLIRDPNAHGIGMVSPEVPLLWTDQFIAKGGFVRLYELLMSPQLQQGGGTSDGVDHQRECLSSLIRVIYLFCLEHDKVKVEEDSEVSDVEESSDDEVVLGGDVNTATAATKKRKGLEKQVAKAATKRARPEMILREGPRFRLAILQILDTTEVLTALLRILYNSVLPPTVTDAQKPNRTARQSRQSLVRLGFEFLHGWAACNLLVFPALSHHPFLSDWLRRLALESMDSAITCETCLFIERMCRLEPEYELSVALLIPLVALMPVAEGIKCLRNAGRDDKFPLRPSPRHFYDSISKLLEIIPRTRVVDKVDLDSLCEQLANSLETRPIYEPRHGNLEDDGLIGLLKVASQVLSHNPDFKFKPAGMKMLLTVYSCLFDLPCMKNRDLPKCKSAASRTAGYFCLTEMSKCASENFMTLGRLLLKDELSRNCVLWDYWPRDDTRADCGYVGIMNLGATCYMATTMQHLYMIPEARKAIFEAVPAVEHGKLDPASTALHEMQRMFAVLLESERKAYSPEAFCRVYEMNNQTLNPTEQKDMMEFFSDLVAKMEEMSPTMKQMVKRLFTGTNCNTVVSLDCGHVSQTTEDFTTVRCQVNNMRNLYESLNDVCVKDVLEGNNMYKCSQCDREVRAEKQACFRSLPEILVLNTLRYSFNMVTMQREKVNTHFSFPNVLDMSSYMEENIFKKAGDAAAPLGTNDKYKFELIGVTVHTGTADGGHYYSFIRDLEHGDEDRWYLFNDAEVRIFDPDQLGEECFGGESQQKPFEHPGDRYLDFGLEKTNSAYMLFYERAERVREQLASSKSAQLSIPKDLQKWVFEDTISFIRDTIVFDRNYFDFIWRLCSLIPSTILTKEQADCFVMSGQLGSSFVWETLIHARDRMLLSSFFDLTTKWGPFHSVIAEWFFRQMVDDQRWLYTILVQCPISTVRYTFQRYIISLITKLRHPVSILQLYLQENAGYSLTFLIGKFCRQCIALLNDLDVRMHWKHLSDLMHILLEFAKLGVAEAFFLVANGQIFSFCYHFYNYVRRLKDVRSSLIGPLFPTNFLEMAILGSSDDHDGSDRFSPELEKDKPNTLSLMVTLLRTCVETFQENVFTCKQMHAKGPSTSGLAGDEPVPTHSDIEQFLGGVSDQEQLDFICSLFRDGVEPHQAPRLAVMLYFDKPDKAKNAVFHIVQKVVDLSYAMEGSLPSKKERDRELQSRAYLNALAEMVRGGVVCSTRLMGENVLDAGQEDKDQLERLGFPLYTDYLLERLDSLMIVCPTLTCQWISDHGRNIEPLRRWTLDHLDLVLDKHGVAIGKPPSSQREDLQLEVARLIISIPGEGRLRDVFSSPQNGLLFQAAKEKQANALTVLDKVEVHLTVEQNHTMELLIAKILSYLADRLPEKYPLILDPSVSTESYQWILFAVQFFLIDERKKKIVLENYAGLRQLLMAQLVPAAKHGGNRQALIQLFAVASLRYAKMASAILQDTELVDALLSDAEIRLNEETIVLDREGRYTGAVLLLLNSLCLTNGEFAVKMAKDARLLAKLKKAMHLKMYDMCRRPLVAIIGTLIKDAPFPPDQSTGETFRRAMFDLIVAVRLQWPTSSLIASQIIKKIIDDADAEFHTYAIENKLMEILTENFRTYSTAVNKALSYMYEEAHWSMMTLRKLRAFAAQNSEANPLVREALQNWMTFAKLVGRDMNLDVVGTVEGTGPVELSPRNVVTPRRR